MDDAKLQTLCEIFRIVLDLQDDADPSLVSKLRQKDWDSLATVSIAAGIESEFGITIEPGDYERMTSFAAIEVLLGEKGL